MENNTPEEKPWERQKNEPQGSYGYFIIYRDLGPFRTMEQIRQKMIEMDIPKIPSLSNMTSLGAKWKWVNRCKAWDEHLDEVARTEQELAIKEMTKRHAEKSKELQEKILEIMNNELEKGSTPNKSWICNITVHSYYKTALLERLSRGLTTDKIETKNNTTIKEDKSSKDYEEIKDLFAYAEQGNDQEYKE